jgi:hypothetical protein
MNGAQSAAKKRKEESADEVSGDGRSASFSSVVNNTYMVNLSLFKS